MAQKAKPKMAADAGADLLVPFPANPYLRDAATKGFVELSALRAAGLDPDLLPVGEEGKLAHSKLGARTARDSSHFIVMMSPEQLALNSALRAAGLYGERIIQDLQEGRYLVEREGLALRSVGLERIGRLGKDAILGGIGDLMGRFHTLRTVAGGSSFNAAVHGHPHEGNIVLMPGDAFGIIDLKYSSLAKVDWESPGEIIRTFADDWMYMNRCLHETLGSANGCERMFDRMASFYPMEAAKKATLMSGLGQLGILGGRTSQATGRELNDAIRAL